MDGQGWNRRCGAALAALAVLAALLLAALGEGSPSPRPGERAPSAGAAEPAAAARRREPEDEGPSAPRYVRQIRAWLLGDEEITRRDPEVPAGDGFSGGPDRRLGPPCR